MAGASLRFDLSQTSAVSRRLQRSLSEAGDREELLDEIGAYGVTSTQLRFETGKGPDGQDWEPTARGGQILVLSGRLLGSIVHQVVTDSVEWGTNVIYAAIHQFGGTIRPKNADRLVFQIGSDLIFANEVTIPARPYLGINADDEAEISNIVQDFLAEAFEQ